MRFDRQARHGVELFRRKCLEVCGVPQRKQRHNKLQRVGGFDRDRDQAEEFASKARSLLTGLSKT